MKLFVSVGTQLPFPRLINSIENLNIKDISNITYQTADSNFKSEKGRVFDYLKPEEYSSFFNDCDVFITHAGMGSIITAIDNNKPIVIMPRLHKFGEHRNDHQLATAHKFRDFKNVYYVENEADISKVLTSMNLVEDNLVSCNKLELDMDLIAFIKGVIND